MRQVYLLAEGESLAGEEEDGLPVGERLGAEIQLRFSRAANEPPAFDLSAGDALFFLREFYNRYELSQPQRRVWRRFEKKIENLNPSETVRFITAEVSAARHRKFSKKA